MKQLAELLQNVPGIKSIELSDVQGLAQLLRDAPEIGSIEVKGFFGTKVVITRTGTGAPAFVTPPISFHGAAPAAHTVPRRPRRTGSPARRPAPSRRSRRSSRRWSGRSTSRPSPAPKPYVKVGTRVTPGQMLCIIEAMKIMNEIESEFAGVVREVLVDDAQPVEYGQVLFRVDPNG